MEKHPSRKPLACKFLIVMHVLLGLGAVFGGLVLIFDPSGGIIKMPTSLLENSPFNTFLIPGIILFTVLGVFPLVVSYALVTKRHWKAADRINIFAQMHWSWGCSLSIGFALIIWITVEVYFIKGIAAIHLVYIFLGLMIQAVTLLPSVQKYYRLI